MTLVVAEVKMKISGNHEKIMMNRLTFWDSDVGKVSAKANMITMCQIAVG